MKYSALLFTLVLSTLLGCISKDRAVVDLTDINNIALKKVKYKRIIPLDGEIVSAENSADGELALKEATPNSIFDSPERKIASTELYIEEGPSTYIVQKNDTLMLVAWKLYGDYTKWREIRSLNLDKVQDGHKISEGDHLIYHSPEVAFEWRPEGSPYLILRGDTLGKISYQTYRKRKYWRDIWHNNGALIKTPDLIFAGFTIYTPDIKKINHQKVALDSKRFKKR